MNTDMLTVILGFIEGFALIISPCILTILPIFLASSLTGSKKRPLGMIVGFSAIFAIFAYFSRQLAVYSGVDLNDIRYVSYGLLVALGFIMLFSSLGEMFSRATQRFADLGAKYVGRFNDKSDYVSGIVIGGLLALVWTPCAGPILATIIVQTVIQKTTFISFLTLFAFAVGAAIPMLVIALYGRRLMYSLRFFKAHGTLARQLLGMMILANVAFMIYQEHRTDSSSIHPYTLKTATALQDGLWRTYQAPPIEGIDTWINSPALALNTLKGKVVLVDFWTYSCINCIRTLPYLNHWYQQYNNKGLVIIGVHAPEFDFEKNGANVKDAVARYHIHYPVALDNQYKTWQNFSNHYWPAQYLMNKEGRVVYEHFGEGNDEVMENNIRFLLGIDKIELPFVPAKETASLGTSPETYLGYARADSKHSPRLIINKDHEYPDSAVTSLNDWRLKGGWHIFADKIVSTNTHASFNMLFRARKVFVVMGSANNTPIKVNLFLNGENLKDEKGKDVMESSVVVNHHALYEVIQLKNTEKGLLQINASAPGLEIYTITFGD